MGMCKLTHRPGGTHEWEGQKRTRVQLTIEPELGDLLKELAQETNSSLSGLIAELLMEMAPVLEKNLNS